MLYKAGAEVSFLTFNAIDMDNTKWFSQKQLIWSSWTDLKTYEASQIKYFDIYGAPNVIRSFEISTSYIDCDNDGGWLVITSTSSDGCPWAKRNNISSIVYSASTTSVNFNHYGKIRHFLSH